MPTSRSPPAADAPHRRRFCMHPPRRAAPAAPAIASAIDDLSVGYCARRRPSAQRFSALAHLWSYGLWGGGSGYWGSSAATVAPGHKGQPVPRTAAGAITPGPRQRAPCSGGRTNGLRTGPVGRAGVVGASEMATGGLVGSTVILAPTSSPPLGPENAQASQAPEPAVLAPAVPWALSRLHQLRGVGDAKVLKSLGRSSKGRHYRG
jgi:hypothetical protein